MSDTDKTTKDEFNDKAAEDEKPEGAEAEKPNTLFVTRAEDSKDFVIKDLTLKLPDGSVLINEFSQTLKRGDRLMLTGPSGTGKSTLLRALAGFWPFGDGRVEWPTDASVIIVPQKPYLPNVTLKGILSYPDEEGKFTDAEMEDVLRRVGHDKLVQYMDREDVDGDKLSRQLSLGEQQRLVFARILLHKPDILMLDEVTASLDQKSGQMLYDLMVKSLPDTLMISVAHKAEIKQYHTLHADLTGKKWTIKPIKASKPKAKKGPTPPTAG